MPPHHKPSDFVTIGDISKSLTEWAADLGTPVQTILGRLARGQSIELACTKPLANRGGQNRGKKADADVLAVDEVQQLLQAGRNSETAVRDTAILAVAYRSGLRCFEINKLGMKDADIARGTLTVQHGKGDKLRTVGLDPVGWSYVLKWLDQRATWSVGEDAPLFCTRKGGVIATCQVRAMMQRRVKRTGIEKHAHIHGLRRTMASEMAAEGVPLIDIAGVLGHANVATTDKYIKRINPVSVINASQKRGWGTLPVHPTASSSPGAPPPGWLDRLRAEIGERLVCFHDGRTSEERFQAVVLLY